MITRRRILKYAASIGVLATAGTAVLARRANAYYSGPVSDHFNGEQFFNPGHAYPQSLGRLAHLYTRETWAPWPTEAPSPYADRPPPRVPGASARLTFIGHASWLIQSAGYNILVDPHWSQRASPLRFAGPKRVNAPGVAFDDLPHIDAVLVTHNHYDHLDLPTLARLWQRDRPRLITPLGNDTIVAAEVPEFSAHAVDWGQTVPLRSDLAVHTVPTLHWSARGLRDRRHALRASFVLETPAGKIYIVGDSGFGDGELFRDIGRTHAGIRLALLPIGAYEPRWFMRSQHMNPEEAVAAFQLIGAEQALGHHWGTFQLTTEAHDLPPNELAGVLTARNIAQERFRAVRPGQVLEI
jgi:L-ascorbate metabolism protein UlaG (beta-lactamase superfamily)